jgi:hypothetical protein
MEEYNTKTYVVQRVLSAQVDTSENIQCHNLFQIFFVIKDCRVRTIIDGGSCNNLVSAYFVAKIGLTTRLHTHPVDTLENIQRHNLFQIFFVIKDCRVRTIIDGGSCNNLVSADFVAKIGLMTCLHTHQHYI